MSRAFNTGWTAPSPLAVGLRTDHLIAGLPILDDSELGDLSDRYAIQDLGRIPGNDYGGWGREDRLRIHDGEITEEAGWVAFTTSPSNHDLAWVVRQQQDGTRSVLLYGSTEAATAAFTAFAFTPELYALGRGGYHLTRDGLWRRPRVDGRASHVRYATADREAGVRAWTDIVPGSRTVSVADYRHRNTKVVSLPGPGGIARFSSDRLALTTGFDWRHSLTAWVHSRGLDGRRDAYDFDRYLIGLTSMETSAEEMVDSTTMAGLADMTPNAFSTARMRGGRNIPQPYLHTAAGPLWTATVAQLWSEALLAD